MSTVYVVSRGCYSDYSIVAMFSTREAAQSYADELLGIGGYSNENATVEEWELDVPRETLFGAWAVTVDQDGKVMDSELVDHFKPGEPARQLREDHFEGFGLTEEHARRSADELRRATLALEGRQKECKP